MANWSSLLSLHLLAFLMSSEDKIANKKSVKILILTGGLLLFVVIFASLFQEQIGKSFLNVVVVAFIAFVLVARLVVGLIDLHHKS